MKNVEKYLNNLGEEQKLTIEVIIKTIKNTIPNVEEVVSYGMPVYKYKGKYLIGVAAFKDHMSIFPGAGGIEKFKRKLKEFKTSRGTVQFTLAQPLPKGLLVEIIEYRRKQIDSE